MTNGCTVTKFNGGIQKSNLPVYGTVFLDLVNPVGTGLLFVKVKSGSSVTLTSEYPMHNGSSSSQAVYTILVDSSYTSVFFKSAELPSVPTKRLVKITGDIYDLIALTEYSVSQKMFDFSKNNVSSGLNSIMYGDSLIATGFNNNESIPVFMKAISVYTEAHTDYITLNTELENNIEWVSGLSVTTSFGLMKPLASAENLTLKTPGLKYADVRVTGNLNDLPLNIEKLFVISGITGTVEGFVEDRISKGRISGFILLQSGIAGVTYNGVALNALSGQPKVEDSFYCFVWNGSTITISNTIPAGYVGSTMPDYINSIV